MNTTTTITTEAPALFDRIATEEHLRPMARALDSIRRANYQLRENLQRVREEAAQLEEQATTGSCYLQTTIGSSLFYDPTEHANRASSAAIQQNAAIESFFSIASLLGFDGEDAYVMLDEVIQYVCEHAGDTFFAIRSSVK